MMKITCPSKKKIAGLPRIFISGTGISPAERAGREFIKAVLRGEAEKLNREFMKEVEGC